MPQHECTQEETINDIDKQVHLTTEGLAKQSGLLKAAGGFISVAIVVLGGLCGIILGKLTAIESLLTAQQVVQGRLEERYISLDKRVSDIEKRHEVIDQSSYRKPR